MEMLILVLVSCVFICGLYGAVVLFDSPLFVLFVLFLYCKMGANAE